VGVSSDKRNEVIETINMFRGKVVDVAKKSVTVELSGNEQKLSAFVELMKPYEILELSRTGVIAMARGMQIQRERAATVTGTKTRKRSLDAPAAPALPPS